MGLIVTIIFFLAVAAMLERTHRQAMHSTRAFANNTRTPYADDYRRIVDDLRALPSR